MEGLESAQACPPRTNGSASEYLARSKVPFCTSLRKKAEVWLKFANCFSEAGFTSTREKDPDIFIVS